MIASCLPLEKFRKKNNQTITARSDAGFTVVGSLDCRPKEAVF